MARIRTIKPQFWLDENLGSIKREARMLYIGLWNLSDDRGVFEWRPARIRIEIFPYDDDIKTPDIEEWLQTLIQIGNVIYFEENGKPYGYIPTFLEHQEIKNPSKWTFTEGLPDISRQEDSTTPVLPQSGDSPTPVLPVGNREWGIGSREKEKESNKEMSETKVSDESLRLATLLRNLMIENDDKAKIPKDLTKWALEIDRINRLDHRSFEVIEAVIKFSQSDSFWKTNVLSPSSLRKNFPKLYLQHKNQGGQNGRFSEHRSTAGQNSNRPQTQERTSDEYRRGLEGI